jgi:2-oxoglutarate dehydrogenase E1 component
MGAWTFIEPYLEWVLAQVGAKAQASALCRPPGVRRHRHGPDVAHMAQLKAFLEEALGA